MPITNLLTITLPVFFTLIIFYLIFYFFKVKTNISNDDTLLVSRINKFAPLIIFISAFLLNLSVLFSHWLEYNSGNIGLVGGFIPFSDALNYFTQANYYIQFGEIDGRSLWRPFSHTFNASLLKFSNLDIKTTLFLMTSLVSISTFFVANAVFKKKGLFAALVITLLLSVYYSRYNGSFNSENLGFLVGNLSFVFFIESIYKQKKWLFFLGVFAISMALNIRSGPMFVIPVLAMWGGYLFKGKLKYNWLTMAICMVIGFLTLSTNSRLTKYVASPEVKVASQGNFAYFLYGLSKGGEDWKAIRKDYPGITGVPIEQRTDLIYEYAFKEIKSNPFALVKGVLYRYVEVFRNPFAILFRFEYKNLIWLNILIVSLGIIGFVLEIKKVDKNLQQLFLVIFVGILLSIPFIMAGDRFYTPIMAFAAAFVTIGLQKLVYRYFKNTQATAKITTESTIINGISFPFYIFTFLIIALIFLGPLWVKNTSGEKQVFKFFENQCEQTLGIFSLKSLTQIAIKNEKDADLSVFSYEAPREKIKTKIKSRGGEYERIKEGEFLAVAPNLYGPSSKTYMNMILTEDLSKYEQDKYAVVCLEKYTAKLYKAKVITVDTFDNLAGSKSDLALSNLREKNPYLVPDSLLKPFLSLNEVKWKKLWNAELRDDLTIVANKENDKTWEYAGAGSDNVLKAGEDGYFESLIMHNDKNMAFGFSEIDIDNHFKTIQYGLLLRSNRKLYVFENGESKWENERFKRSDILGILRKDGVISYLKNGKVFHTSAIKNNNDLIIDCSFYEKEGSLLIRSTF